MSKTSTIQFSPDYDRLTPLRLITRAIWGFEDDVHTACPLTRLFIDGKAFHLEQIELAILGLVQAWCIYVDILPEPMAEPPSRSTQAVRSKHNEALNLREDDVAIWLSGVNLKCANERDHIEAAIRTIGLIVYFNQSVLIAGRKAEMAAKVIADAADLCASADALRRGTIARALVQLKGTKTAEGRLAEGHYLTPSDRREAMAALSAVGGADLAACVGCAGVSNQATRMLTRMFQVHGARPPCRALPRAWHVHRAPLSFW